MDKLQEEVLKQPKQELAKETKEESVENGTENMVHVLIMPKITFDPVTGKPKENGVVQIMGKNEFMIFKRATLPGKEIYVIHEP